MTRLPKPTTSPRIDDRQHQPVAELVSDPSSPACHRQSRGHQLLLVKLLSLMSAQQRVPTDPATRPCRTAPPRSCVYKPLVQIGLHRRAPGAAAIGRRTTAPPCGSAPAPVWCRRSLSFCISPLCGRDIPARLARKLHRLRKGEVLDLHDEVEHAAALLQPKQWYICLSGATEKGGRFLAVEGHRPK